MTSQGGRKRKHRLRPFWVREGRGGSGYNILVVPLEPPGGKPVGPRGAEIIGPPSRAYVWIGDEDRMYGSVPLKALKAAIKRFEEDYHDA